MASAVFYVKRFRYIASWRNWCIIKIIKRKRGFYGKRQKGDFSPKTQEVKPVDQKYSQEEIQAAQAIVEQEEKDKGMSVVQRLSVVWTIVSTVYAIVSTCTFVAKKWVDSAYAYALIPMLVVLVITFVVLVVLTFKDKKKLQTNVKNYKKILGIFKAFVNVFSLPFPQCQWRVSQRAKRAWSSGSCLPQRSSSHLCNSCSKSQNSRWNKCAKRWVKSIKSRCTNSLTERRKRSPLPIPWPSIVTNNNRFAYKLETAL